MFGLFAFIQLIALSAGAEAGRERSYTIVTGAALRSALVGKNVQATPCYSSDQCAVVFGKDGRTYYRHGDRIPWQRGSYAIHADQVCAVVPPGPETCHLLLRSGQGTYAMVRSNDPSLRAQAVRITDAEGIPLPDDAVAPLAGVAQMGGATCCNAENESILRLICTDME